MTNKELMDAIEFFSPYRLSKKRIQKIAQSMEPKERQMTLANYKIARKKIFYEI